MNVIITNVDNGGIFFCQYYCNVKEHIGNISNEAELLLVSYLEMAFLAVPALAEKLCCG
jgi:hypothetical protein